MNPYLLINLGTTNFVYVYAKGIIQSPWPECEPVSSTAPEKIEVEVIDADPESTTRVRNAFILVKLNGELFVPALAASKYFTWDADGSGLLWEVYSYPKIWLTEFDFLDMEILESFSYWTPKQLPEDYLIAEELLMHATTFRFKPDPEPYTHSIKVAIGNYHQQIFFALASYEIELRLITVKTDVVPAQLFNNINDLEKALIDWWSRIWSKTFDQWIVSDREYFYNFMLKLKDAEGKLKAKL